jgi:hypothetical protein
LDEERYERRYALAVRQIDPGAVIADVEAQVADSIDPTAHPLYGVVAYYLEACGPETRRLPWCLEALAAAYDRLVKEALTRLMDDKLADFGAWGRTRPCSPSSRASFACRGASKIVRQANMLPSTMIILAVRCAQGGNGHKKAQSHRKTTLGYAWCRAAGV